MIVIAQNDCPGFVADTKRMSKLLCTDVLYHAAQSHERHRATPLSPARRPSVSVLSTKLANAEDYPKLEVVRASGAARDHGIERPTLTTCSPSTLRTVVDDVHDHDASSCVGDADMKSSMLAGEHRS
jgi:hypothetical protein